MKKDLFLLVSALIFAFSSCNNDEAALNNGKVEPGGNGGEAATLSISIAGKIAQDAQPRAIGSYGTDEAKVNNGIIYVLDSDGNIISKAFFSPNDFTSPTTTKIVATTTEAKSVTVLLNVGITKLADIAGSKFDIATKTQLDAVIVNLINETTGVALETKDNLIMSGVSTSTISFAGTPLTATTNVTVSRIASRVQIFGSLEPTSSYQGKLRIKGAVLLNLASLSKLFGSSLVPSTGVKYIQGISSSLFTGFAQTTIKPSATDAIMNVAEYSVSKVPISGEKEEDDENKDLNYFYIFENSSTLPTIIALVADYNPGGLDVGTNQTKYYPVIINKESTGGQDGTKTIKRNSQYKVNIKIKGMGVNNPYELIDPASLNVSITVADWNAVINADHTFE